MEVDAKTHSQKLGEASRVSWKIWRDAYGSHRVEDTMANTDKYISEKEHIGDYNNKQIPCIILHIYFWLYKLVVLMDCEQWKWEVSLILLLDSKTLLFLLAFHVQPGYEGLCLAYKAMFGSFPWAIFIVKGNREVDLEKTWDVDRDFEWNEEILQTGYNSDKESKKKIITIHN